jgi:hypothetical protein
MPKKVILSFYLEPNVFSKKMTELEHLKKDESDYIAKKLNEYLRNEILKTIGPGKPGISKLVHSIKLDYRDVKDSTLDTVVKKKLLTAAKKDKTLAKEIRAVEKIFEKTPVVSIGNLLNLGLPLKDHPVVAKDFRREKALAFAKIINLSDDLAVKLAEKDLVLEDANDADLEALVREKILTSEQKKDLLLTIDLSRLSGENIALIKALKTNKLKSMEDFVSWNKSDWAKLIKDHDIPLPKGEDSIDSYAENLRENIEKTFPTQHFLKRIIKNNYDSEIRALNSVSPLVKHNEMIIDGASIDSSKIDWTDINSTDKETIEKDLDLLLAFSNSYGKLGIADIVNDKQMSLDQKNATITLRLSALDTFYKNNPHIDLRLIDFLKKDTAINWNGIQESERPMVRKQMMAYQRTLTLSPDYETSQKLLAKGLDSAMVIASMPEDEFRKAGGLDLEKSRNIYLKAQENSIAIEFLWGDTGFAVWAVQGHRDVQPESIGQRSSRDRWFR